MQHIADPIRCALVDADGVDGLRPSEVHFDPLIATADTGVAHVRFVTLQAIKAILQGTSHFRKG